MRNNAIEKLNKELIEKELIEWEKNYKYWEKNYKYDVYKMSLGQTACIFRDGDIAPTRKNKHLNSQKSSIIEVLLLNLPLPSLIVQEQSDFKWEVVDGNLILFAIMDFMGIAPEGQEAMPFTLQGPFHHLHSLEGMSWEDFTPELKTKLKNRKLYFQIYKKS